MKIELNSPANSPVSSETVSRVNTSSTTSSQNTAEDRITFHSTSIESLTNQALQSPEVRQTAVQSLRQSVSNGEYSVDPTKTASAIVSNQ